MKVSLSRDALHAATKMAASIADPRSPLPYFHQTHVSGGEEIGVKVQAVDQSTSASVTLMATGKSAGGFVVDSKLLHEVVSLCSGDVVTLETSVSSVIVSYGKSKVTLPTVPDKGYPALHAAGDEPVKVGVDELADALRKVIFVAEADSSSGSIGSVVRLTCADGKLSAHVAETRRIAYASTSGAHGKGFPEASISRKGATAILRALEASEEEDCELSVSREAIAVHVGPVLTRTSIGAKVLASQFVPWRRVIEGDGQIFRVDVAELGGAVARAMMFTTTDQKVNLRVVGKFLQVDRTGIAGDAMTVIDLEKAVESTEIMLNGRYIREALAVIGTDDVEVQLRGSLLPAVLRPTDGSDQILVIAAMDNK